MRKDTTPGLLAGLYAHPDCECARGGQLAFEDVLHPLLFNPLLQEAGPTCDCFYF